MGWEECVCKSGHNEEPNEDARDGHCILGFSSRRLPTNKGGGEGDSIPISLCTQKKQQVDRPAVASARMPATGFFFETQIWLPTG
mmetsp:Transcript_32760/g.79339  ORF Transcript_32760/g.79339 Transcript_32760/m.79339 type:complete len:85 (+) Transcript_32760:708-962(+)